MKTIWCNGTFDILHPGHIELFKIAKSLGDRLIVATDSPDVMLLGSDWEGKNIVGGKYAKEIKFLPRLVEHASSDIINKITNI